MNPEVYAYHYKTPLNSHRKQLSSLRVGEEAVDFRHDLRGLVADIFSYEMLRILFSLSKILQNSCSPVLLGHPDSTRPKKKDCKSSKSNHICVPEYILTISSPFYMKQRRQQAPTNEN